MTAMEEITERFEQALQAQAEAEQALDKATSEYGEAKRVVNAARQVVNKLGDIMNALDEVNKLQGISSPDEDRDPPDTTGYQLRTETISVDQS